MTTYYSDHFTANGLAADSYDNQIRVDAGIGHGRIRYKRGQATTHASTFTTTDTLRMLTMKSGDRLLELWVSTDGTATTGTVDIGLYLSGDNHDGASLGTATVNLFADALPMTTLASRTNILAAEAGSTSIPVTTESATSGKTIWAIANMGDATYTVNPMIDFDITILPTIIFDAATIITMEAYYTSGD